MNNLVSKTYRDIIDEVCAKVRTEFIEGSVSEDVLEELRGLWEAKAIEAGIVDTEYPEEKRQTLPRVAPDSKASGAALSNKRARVDGGYAPAAPAYTPAAVTYQNPPQYTAHPTAMAMHHHPHQPLTYPPAYGYGYAPAPTTMMPPQQPQYPPASAPPGHQGGHPSHPSIPQQDGSGETPADDTAGGGTKGDTKATKTEGGGQEEEEEVDNLDDVALSDDEDDGEDIEDFVLCTFEKVHRTKAKWKAALKNGIAHIDGRDYVFNRCNGEMRFH